MMLAKVKELYRRWVADHLFLYLFVGLVVGSALAVALVYSVKWKFGVALFGFITLLVVDLFSLNLALLGVFFAIPFDRLGKLGPESVMTVAKVLIAVLMLAWAARIVVERRRQTLEILLHSPLFLLATLTLVFSLFSVVNARDYDIFLAQNVRRMNNYVLFILIVTIVDKAIWVRRIFYVLLFAYFFVGLTVLYEIDTGQSILQTVWGEKDTALEYTLQSGEFRVGGPGGDPDFLAVSVIFPSLIGISLVFSPWIPRLAKVLSLPVILLMLISLLATGSRGGLVAFLTGISIFWLFTEMRHKFLIAFAGGVTLVIGVIGLSLMGTASTERYTGGAGGKSLTYRLGWTEMAFMMIEDHPFVGIGTGNFPKEYNRYSPTIPQIPREPFWTHNSFLQTWAENGILAFIVYALLYVTAALAMLRVIFTTKDPELRHLAVLLLSTVAAYFFFAGTSNILENENYWIVFALVTLTSYFAREQIRGGETPGGGSA